MWIWNDPITVMFSKNLLAYSFGPAFEEGADVSGVAVSFARQLSMSRLTLVEYGIEGKGVIAAGGNGSVGQAHSGLGELCPQAVRLSKSASSSSTQGSSAGLGSFKGGVFFTLKFDCVIKGFRDCFCGLLGLCFFHF